MARRRRSECYIVFKIAGPFSSDQHLEVEVTSFSSRHDACCRTAAWLTLGSSRKAKQIQQKDWYDEEERL